MTDQALHRNIHKIILVSAVALSVGIPARWSIGGSAVDLEHGARQALHTLYAAHPAAIRLSELARAILVFPKIIQAGQRSVGSYGEGVLLRGGRTSAYFNSVSACCGWQAGAEWYGYVLFLISRKAVQMLTESHGWEIGRGSSVVAVDANWADQCSPAPLSEDAYAFVFDQQGCITGMPMEGTRISPILKK